MTELYYYNDKGDRKGPHSMGKMKELATRRVVKRTTIIENAKGDSTKAENIAWIEFPPELGPEPPKPFFKWLGFIFKLVASLGTIFGSVWTLALTSKFILILVVFLGFASIVVALSFRFLWFLLFQQ